MKWKKLGLVFSSKKQNYSMWSHASVPIAEHIKNDLFKIYFSSRDKNNKSYTNFILINIKNPSKILSISKKPILIPGKLGEFDDSGSMATWITQKKNTSFLFYIGWNLGLNVPFRNSIGLAIKKNQGEFLKYSNGPVIDRTISEPHFNASCSVLIDRNIWKMWYLSCTEWKLIKNKPQHKYHIKYAESKNGIDWVRKGIVAIDYKSSREYAISRPSVIKDKNIWKMWYSYRGKKYRIGYAESKDGKRWNRLDHLAGISPSKNGWDSEMIEYPFVFNHNGSRYMLYNGNGFGASGFGLAILE
jgi:hypothetical protein